MQEVETPYYISRSYNKNTMLIIAHFYSKHYNIPII
jgi:hypothetical protein